MSENLNVNVLVEAKKEYTTQLIKAIQFLQKMNVIYLKIYLLDITQIMPLKDVWLKIQSLIILNYIKILICLNLNMLKKD